MTDSTESTDNPTADKPADDAPVTDKETPTTEAPAPITTTAPATPRTFVLPPIPAIGKAVPANPPQPGHAVTAKPSDATAQPAELPSDVRSSLAAAKHTALSRIKEILAEHNHQESDIGHGHEYWDLKNQLRTIEEKLGDALFK